MASSVNHVCTVCHDDGISIRAVTWCIECEVLFCENCEKPHSKSRLSKNHKTMSAEDYNLLPTFMQEKSSQCREHNTELELYCSFHACPCCVQCFTDEHKTCQDIKPLSEIVKQVKSSASVHLFEKDLNDVKQDLDTTIKYMQTRISTINTQKKKAIREIRYMRKSINDYLKKLEKDILNDLESKHAKLKSDMATLVQQMEERTSQLNQLQSQFTTMTKYATELQMYIGLREIEKTISETVKYIEDLENGDHIIEKNLELNIASGIQTISSKVKSFGDIYINTASSTLLMKAGRKDQAQNLVSKLDQIKPSFLTQLNNQENRETLKIKACRILPDGKFIILPYRKGQLLLFSNDGIFIRIVVTFTEDTCDACVVRNNTVAVALGNHTTLMDIETNKIIETIKPSHECYAVASDGETLVIRSYGRQNTIVNLNDMSHTIIEGMKNVGFISLFKGNFYGTKEFANEVSCYDSAGEPLWTLQDKSIVYPVGMTLDMNGFVYIASLGNNSVVVVSPDGKSCKTILTETDGIDEPYGIDINKDTGMMIVSSKLRADIYKYGDYDTAFVYQI